MARETMGNKANREMKSGTKFAPRWLIAPFVAVTILFGAPVAAQAADGLSNVNTNNTSINGQTLAFGANGRSALPKSVTIYLWTNGASGGFLNLSNRTINADIKLNNSAYVRNGGSCGSGTTQSGYTFRASYTYSGGASFRSCSIILQLQSGTAVGTYDTTLTYASVGSGSANITGKVTKTQGPAATITGPDAETGNSAYGQVAIGDSSTKTFTLENTGTVDIAADPSLSGTSSYSITSENCANPFPLFATCQVSVKYQPTSEQGTESATLSLSGSGATASMALTASGLQPVADLDVDVSSYDFGDTPVGYPLTKTFTISNTGNTTLSLNFEFSNTTDTAIFTKTGASTCGASLAVGLDCTYQIQFSPQAGGAASYSGGFSATGTTALVQEPAVASVSLAGLRSAELIESYGVYDQAGTTEEKSHSFGTVNLGSNSAYTFTVKNTGNVAITGLSSSVGGTNAARFGRTTTCGASLARNGSCTVTITFTPNRTSTAYGNLSLSATNGGSKDVGLMGAGAGIAILNDQNDNSSETNHRRWADVIGAGGASQFGGDNMRAGFEVDLGAEQDISSVQISNTLTTNDTAPGAGTFASVADLSGGAVDIQRKPGSSQAFISAGVPLSSIVGTGLGSYGFSNGTNLILGCIGGTATTNDRRVWFRIVNDDGQVSTATGSILRLTNVSYGCPNGGPYISSQRILQVDGVNQPSGTMNAIVSKGDPLKLQFNTNNRPAPLLGGDPGFVDAVNWRLRSSDTGAMLRWNGSSYVSCAAPCTGAINDNTSRYNFASRDTGTQQMDIVAPNQRGRWVIEAAPQGAGEDDRRFFHVGSILVNDSADPSLTFGGTLGPRPDTDTEYTILANPVTDPGDSSGGGTAQVIEWDLNGDRTDGPGGDGFEFIGEGDSGGNPPAEALARSFDTTGKEPGLFTIRARVTDNGAIMAADDSARQKIFEYTTTINSLPEAVTENFDLEADDPQGSGVEFRATDENDDPYYVSITPAGSNDGQITDPLVTQLDQNDPAYEWPADYTGNDTFAFRATDDKRGTGPLGTLTVRVRPNTTIDDSGVLDSALDTATPPLLNPDPSSGFLGSTVGTGAAFDFSSPQEPVVGYECRLLRDNPVGYTGNWATADVVEDWDTCESINASATAATGSQDYDSLEDGLYRFEVRAVNDVDVADGTPAFRTWRVDNTAPVAEVRVGPTSNRPGFQPRFSNQIEPTYTLRASDAERGAQIHNTFECRVLFGPLSGEWKDCGDPSDALGSSQFPLLGADPGFGLSNPFADGSYLIEFRSTDEVGNLGEPTLETLIIDTAPPQTALASGPEGLVNSRDLAYVISSTQANSTFDCKVVGDNAGVVFPTSPCPGGSADGSRPQFTVPQDDEYVLTTAATDPATNRDTEPLEIPFEVDATAPNTSIQTVNFGQGNTAVRRTQSRSVTVGFTGSDLQTTTSSGVRLYQCRLDSVSEDAWRTCQSPERLGALSDGSHKLEVRTVDIAGNPDGSPDVLDWVVDRTPPVTTITDGPDAVTNDTDPTFSFTTNESVSGSVCRLDGLPPVACTSPVDLAELGTSAPLADGPHQLTIGSTDIAGNVETASASISWEIDTTVPGIEMLDQPPAFTPAGPVEFAWLVEDGPAGDRQISEEAGSECNFDGSGWEECDRAFGLTEVENSNGPHTFRVRAMDAAGNVSPTMERSWEVRGAPPVAPTISAAQPEDGSATRLTAASISFGHPDEDTGALEGLFCQLDGGPLRACSGNFAADGLADGEHEFRVVARDIFGNQSEPATVVWEIQSKAPVTIITSGPASLTRQTSARITFSSSLQGTFECRIDGAAWAPCTSPLQLTDLQDGPHSVKVRAVSAVLPVGVKDPSPPTRNWTVDATPPEVTIDSAPVGSTPENTGIVEFSSDDSQATFQCKIKGAPWDSCESPLELSGLTPGLVLVQVRALDPAGNLSEPVNADWTVEVPRCPVGFQGTPPNCTEIKPEGNSKPIKATLSGGNLVLPGLADEGAPFEGGQLRLIGRLYKNGALQVPLEGVEFDPLVIEQNFNGLALEVTIAITATGSGVGTLAPGGGLASFQLPVKAQVVVVAGGVPLIPAENNCSLSGIRFDLTGEWDESGKTVSLGSDAVSFPAAPIEPCAPLGETLNGLVGLPRNDIGLALDFTLEDLPDADPAKLSTPKITAPRSISSGKSFDLGAQLRNTGEAAAESVEVCVKSPTALVKGAANRCKVVGTIGAGKSKSVSFKLATKSGKEGKARFQISAEYTSAGRKIVTRTGHVTLMK